MESAVVAGLDDVDTVAGDHLGQAVQRAGMIGQGNSEPDQPPVLDQAALDNAGKQGDVHVAAGDDADDLAAAADAVRALITAGLVEEAAAHEAVTALTAAGLIVAAGTAALVVGHLQFFRAFGPGLAATTLIFRRRNLK